MASSCSLQSGRSKDPDLGMCARELWLLAATFNFDITVVHKPGAELILADALSRAHMDAHARATARIACRAMGIHRVRVRHSEQRFTTDL